MTSVQKRALVYLIGGLIFLIAIILSSCTEPDGDVDYEIRTHIVGETKCVVADGYRSVAISCDWGNR